MNKPRSNKNKGKLGQNEIVEKILTLFPELESDDLRSTPMGMPGEDLLPSAKCRKLLPWCQEVKRKKKKFVGYTFMEQAKAHGKYEPVVHIRCDGEKDWLSIVRTDYLLNLLRSLNGN